MAKKKNKTTSENNNNNNKDEGKKEEADNKMVLKVSMHCDGCASKITKYLRSIKGVESVKAESETGKVTVVGNVDPTKVRDNLEEKIKKKVELVSPQPKKENKKESEPKNNNSNKSHEKKKSDDKKTNEKELVTTSILKMVLHCQGCIEKISKMVLKTKGVLEMSIDKEKENVIVKGTMDVKVLVENLTEKFKRKVEVVAPKKEKENGGGEKEGGEGGGGKKKNKGGGGGGGGGGEGGGEGGGGVKVMEYMVTPQAPFGYYGYENVEGYNGQIYQEMLHVHNHMNSQPTQMFSDENPNACSVM